MTFGLFRRSRIFVCLAVIALLGNAVAQNQLATNVIGAAAEQPAVPTHDHHAHHAHHEAPAAPAPGGHTHKGHADCAVCGVVATMASLATPAAIVVRLPSEFTVSSERPALARAYALRRYA